MGNPDIHVAFALQGGVVHLCLDSMMTKKAPAVSLCRDHVLSTPRAPVARHDLTNIQNFIICKGCESRFNLLGYRKHYAPKPQRKKQNPAQMALF